LVVISAAICLIAGGLVQPATASVLSNSPTNAKLSEIEKLRTESGASSADWLNRIEKGEVQQEPEVCYDQGCLDAGTCLN
jgi:hypothetical protein